MAGILRTGFQALKKNFAPLFVGFQVGQGTDNGSNGGMNDNTILLILGGLVALVVLSK